MARIKKKGTAGQAKNFITRTQAIRKLQISLPDFRRLCIFKGIYPREPRNKRKAAKNSTAATTFYYARDIQYLLHEPLLNKFREHKALAKKIGRALGRGEVGDAARLEKTQTPKIRLDHIIKERYPTFVDALRDIDDALTMLYLFANLPSSTSISPKTIALCQKLCLEFEHYLIMTHSLRKSFLSIKGVYYQATIQGQDIMWLVPYKFVQRVTTDVDFRIMATFVEFYTTLLGFVNFRLYTSIGLVYPPKFDASSDAKGGELSAFTLQARSLESEPRQIAASQVTDNVAIEATRRAEAVASTLASTITPNGSNSDLITADGQDADDELDGPVDTTIDDFSVAAPGADVLVQPRIGADSAATLFANTTFYLSRETPRAPLELLLRAFGCRRVGWSSLLGDGAFTSDESDSRITHQIVDRPPQPSTVDQDPAATASSVTIVSGSRVPGRTYIQPQWVWDCINEGKLLRPDLYAPGATLPPHLSPWVKPKQGAYDPRAPLEEDAESADDQIAGEESEDDDVEAVGLEDADGDALQEDEDEDVEEGNGDDWGGLSSGDEAPKAVLKSALKHPAENEEKKAAARKRRKDAEAAEELERRKMMMSRKKRKLYEKMAYSNAKTDGETERLKAKRRKIEAAKGKGVV